MSEGGSDSLWKSLAISVVPLFFGSLLFTGIIESYKNDSSARKEIIENFYRPMRETQAECQKSDNDLAIKYGQMAGSFQLMLNEFDHLAKTDLNKMSREYQIVLESLLSSHMKTSADLKDLEEKVQNCRTKLFRQYGELAMVTGTYDFFTDSVQKRALKVNQIYANRSSIVEKMSKNNDPKYLMGTVRQILQMSYDSDDQKAVAVKKLSDIGGPVIAAYTQISGNELDLLNTDAKFFEEMDHVFSTEISGRFKRGFIARLFF